MAFTAGFSVNVGDPTKASDVDVLAANDDYLKNAIDTFIANDANNRVLTGTGSGTANAETNLTFDGSTLTVMGTVSATTFSGNVTGGTISGTTGTYSGNVTISKDAPQLIMTDSGSGGGTSDIIIDAIGSNHGFYFRADGASNHVILESNGDFKVDADTLFVDASADRVGVNNASPQAPLHIIGGNGDPSAAHSGGAQLILENNGQTFLELATGTTHYSAITFSDDVASRGAVIYDHGTALGGGADSLHFQTAGSQKAVINASGDFGLGTTSPVALSNQTSLTINGTSVGRVDVKAGGGGGGVMFGTSSALTMQANSGVAVNLDSASGQPITFQVGSSEKARIDSSGDLLVLGGTIRTKSADNSQQYGAIYGNTSEFSINSGVNNLGLYSAGTLALTIDSSQRVGISTSSPTAPIDINTAGNTHLIFKYQDSSTQRSFIATNAGVSTNYNGLVIGSNATQQGTQANTGLSSWYQRLGPTDATGDAWSVAYQAAGGGVVERARIDSSGNMGLGGTPVSNGTGSTVLNVNATTGGATVHLTNNTTGTTNSDGSLFVQSGSDLLLINRESGNLKLRTADTDRVIITSAGTIEIPNQDAINELLFTGTQFTNVFSQTTSGMHFGTTGSGSSLSLYSANAQAIHIDSSQRVGIGTASPAYKFVVSNGGAAGYEFNVNGLNSGVNTLTYNRSTSAYVDSAHFVDNYYIYSGQTPAERFRVESTGVCAFMTPNINIRFNGTATQSVLTNNDGVEIYTGGYIWAGRQGSSLYLNRAGTTGDVAVFYYNNTTAVGSISVTSSATAYNTSSDYRLKENLVPITGAVDRVNALQPRRFNFLSDPNTTVDGFVAHEVSPVVPEAISGEKDAVDEDGNPEYQGIDQSKLVPLLTAAIQELTARIEALEAA